MKLTFIGHAGFTIVNNETLIIMDPWFSKTGAYDSAWLQFPCNHHLASNVLEQVTEYKYTYLYLSHEHKDHFDIEFITTILEIQPEITFIIPNFKSKAFLSSCKSLNAKHIIEVSNHELYQTNDFDIYLFIDESGINHDSGILLKTNEYSFLNLNDCKVFDRLEFVKKMFGEIDVFSVQFSGASWHPICYDMPKIDYLSISKRKKLSKYRSILNSLKTIKPHRYLPTAGPPALLDPLHYHINFEKDSIFPQQFDIVNFLNNYPLNCHIDSIMPGDVYCFEADKYIHLDENRLSESNFPSLIEEYEKKVNYLFKNNENYKPDNLGELFFKYFSLLEAKTSIFLTKEYIRHTLYFAINEIENKLIEVDLNRNTCSITNTLPSENYYFVSYPAWQIQRLLDGHVPGEDLALTFRGKMKRSPDVYDSWISCFYNSDYENIVENIKLIQEIKENNERIKISCNGVDYEIRRFCPHQGADLQYGWAEGNYWVCPKHRWRYNLEKGGLCDSATASINAIKLMDKESLAEESEQSLIKTL